jgi:hypothetical protein
MRSADWDHQPWHLVPLDESQRKTYERANMAIISVLAFFVLGLFVLALGSVETRIQRHQHATAAHLSVSGLSGHKTSSLHRP